MVAALVGALLPLHGVRAAMTVVPHATIHQSQALDCEAAALVIALSGRGVSVSEAWVESQMPDDTRGAVMSGGQVQQWGDPYTGFVGNYNGSEPGHTGYGVYWPPILQAARNAGVRADGGEGWNLELLLRAVERGFPVVVWTIVGAGTPGTSWWTAFDGRAVPYAIGEHAETLVGVDRDAGTVLVANPLTGHDDTLSIGRLSATMQVFGTMAVIVGGGGGRSISATPAGDGYWIDGDDGTVAAFGAATDEGSITMRGLNQPIVGMATTATGKGYWLVAADGGIFPFGDAPGYGSTGNIRLNQPIVGMAATPTGRGYWLVAADGGIFPFGDAPGYGSTGNIRLNQPIVGMAAVPGGGGYWLVAADGGIFPFGPRAAGYGSTGNIHLNQPVVGMAAVPGGGGYWLVAADGGIFPFGPRAAGYGSTGNIHLNRPITGMAAAAGGRGYWLVAADGGIFPFGSAPGYGSAA